MDIIKNPLRAGKLIGTVEREAYHKSEHPRGHPEFAMSRGELVEFNKCPNRWLLGYESEETKATEWGTIIDCLVLTPERFENEFSVTPLEYPATPKKKGEVPEMKPWNRNATYCREWEDAQTGTVVKGDVLTQAQNAVKFLMADKQIAELIQCSEKQVMVVGEYRDEDTGIVVPLKGLIDLLPDREGRFGSALADLKTCYTANPFSWTKAVDQHGYDIQAALYLDLHNATEGTSDRLEFLHVLQESYPPWQVGRRILSEEFVQLGRMKYLSALKRYCQCLKANSWPGFDDGEDRDILNGWRLVQPEAWMINR
jgi:hypothetical protein